MRSRVLVHLLSGLVVAVGMLFFSATPGAAQVEVHPGVRGGVSSTTQEGRASTGRRQGLTVGLFTTIHFPGPFALQPEANYVQKGTVLRGFEGQRYTEEIAFLEGALLAKGELPEWGVVTPAVFAGPAVGPRVEHNQRSGLVLHESEVNMLLGLGVDIRVDDGKVAALTVDARYEIGLRRHEDPLYSSLRTEPRTFRNQGFMITLGVAFQGEPIEAE